MWDTNNYLNNFPLNPGVVRSGPIALPEGYVPGETYQRGIDAMNNYVSSQQAVPPVDPWKTAEKLAPKILAAAMGTHGAMTLLNGFGAPDTGAGLTTGAGVFGDASAILGSAGSDPGWKGKGAQSYDNQNSAQRTRTDQMVTLDTELAGLLQTQAAEVKKLRNEMYGIGGTLLVAAPIAWLLYKIPVTGPQISTVYQIATATACLAADISLQTKQGLRSQQTGAAMNNVASRYAQIADAAQESGPNL
jgi:hypothetical protein